MKLIERIKNLFRKEEDISDGYHTFKELYEYRVQYNAAMINALAGVYPCYKTIRHENGELCFGGGWFKVTIELPEGQVSNHYEMKYWDLFHCKILEKSNTWDGHTPHMGLGRLREFNKSNEKYIIPQSVKAKISHLIGKALVKDMKGVKDYALSIANELEKCGDETWAKIYRGYFNPNTNWIVQDKEDLI